MTNQTVTREQVKEVFTSFFDPLFMEEILNELFPPPFTPKPGQVCMVSEDQVNWFPKINLEVRSNGRFAQHGGISWKYARPQTEEEINGREE